MSLFLSAYGHVFVALGTDIASDLKVVSIGPDRVTLQWQPVRVHGSNRLLETAIRWSRLRNHNGPEVLGQHKVVQSDRDRVTIKDLEIGEVFYFLDFNYLINVIFM